jgi:uncharacterized RDD family membrane protein YckC
VSLPPDTHYAGFWRRLLAVLIDVLWFLPVFWILMHLLPVTGLQQVQAIEMHILQSQNAVEQQQYMNQLIMASSGFGNGWDFLLNWVFPVVVTVFFWVKFRGSPGKLLTRCRVVDAETGGRLGILQGALRYFAYVASMLPLFLGFLWIGWDRRKQGFHDKIAHSVVIVAEPESRS